MPGNPTAPRRRRRSGVRARLVGLVLLPSVALVAGGGLEVVELHRRSSEADRLAAEVDEAASALETSVLASREVRLSELIVQARNFGVSPDSAGEMLGIDLVDDLAEVRRRSADDPRLRDVVADLGGRGWLIWTRAGVDGGSGVASRRLAEMSAAARRSWQRELADVVERRGEVALVRDLQRALESLEASAELFLASNRQLLAASTTIVPELAAHTAAIEDPDVASGRYLAALERAEAAADEHTRGQLGVVARDRSFDEAVARLRSPADGGIDVPTLAAVFRSGLERDAAVERLIEVNALDARNHAVAVGSRARTTYHRTLLVVGALVVGTVGLALAVARSISRPLRRLARRAAEVSDGDLRGTPLGPSGPEETAVLARTLDDAVGNLRAVERGMAALAAGDLDVAADGPPGELGALVTRSVESLAASLAERERLQQRLAHDAAHDALTGLANRRSAMAELDDRLGTGAPLALLFLDIDGFKSVNDEQGHAVGDALLELTAQRLRTLVPDGSLVARLGGDEFVVLAPVADEGRAVGLAATLSRLLEGEGLVRGLRQRLGVSVGVAVARPGDDADRLLTSADAALYRAKRSGGGVQLLDDEVRSELEAEHRLEAELRQALATGRLQVHYQPVFAAAGHLHGVEALVRWRGSDGSLVPPDRFVPVAERSGSVIELDRWVLHEALGQVGRWRRGPFPGLRVSVNVSARTLLAPDHVDDVRAALDRAGVEGSALVVEVTETALLHDLDLAARHIERLRALGVGTSVDDFGTGYTSVSHLRRLPVSEVKIDQSFVQAIGDDERDRLLVDLIARIGTVLSLDVVAEGVETAEQLEAVRALGCSYVQGYWCGRPMDADQLVERFATVGHPIDR